MNPNRTITRPTVHMLAIDVVRYTVALLCTLLSTPTKKSIVECFYLTTCKSEEAKAYRESYNGCNQKPQRCSLDNKYYHQGSIQIRPMPRRHENNSRPLKTVLTSSQYLSREL